MPLLSAEANRVLELPQTDPPASTQWGAEIPELIAGCLFWHPGHPYLGAIPGVPASGLETYLPPFGPGLQFSFVKTSPRSNY